MPPGARVEASLLRLLFNASNVLGRVQAGSATETVVKNKEVPFDVYRQKGFPPGTRSQFVIYEQGAEEIARAHRYVYPDGQIGASGRPDPKRIMCCGVILFGYRSPIALRQFAT